MTANKQPVSSEIPQPRRRGLGKPWPRGISGNPAGRQDTKRFRAIVDALTAELAAVSGTPVPSSTLVLIEEVAALKLSKGDPVRRANGVTKLLTAIGLDSKPKPKQPDGATLGDILRSGSRNG